LVVDSGNALYRIPGVPDDAAKARAAFILKTMAQLGTAAMAAGARDLSGGAELLKQQAQKVGLKVLSANLLGQDKKRVFPASAVVSQGGLKVGLIGVTAANVSGAEPPAPAVIAEAKKIRAQSDVVVVLAATSYADALQLATQAGDSVDFVLQSGESRMAGFPQRQEKTYVMASGERGRQVGRLDLTISAKGSFTDLTEVERNKQTVKLLQARIDEAHQKLSASPDGGQQLAWAQNLASFEQRQREVEAQIKAGSKPSARSFSLEFTTLGTEVADDAALQAQVAQIEPAPH
jgi:2',3'-cyclic-nucleotide 2'-phosphodiesterase (5'-nucleotidase family)